MKSHLKILLVAAFAVPVFIELRTVLGDFVGFEMSLPVAVIGGVVAAIVLVALDEAWSSDRSMSL